MKVSGQASLREGHHADPKRRVPGPAASVGEGGAIVPGHDGSEIVSGGSRAGREACR